MVVRVWHFCRERHNPELDLRITRLVVIRFRHAPA